MKVAYLVPWRAGEPYREANWAWVKWRHQQLHPDIPIVIGSHEDGPFARGTALNRAAMESDADVLIIADADTFVARSNLTEAVEMAWMAPGQVIAYDKRIQLSRLASERILRNADLAEEAPIAADGKEFYSVSSCVAVSRYTWEISRGFDSRFAGWGAEDWQWHAACFCFFGAPRRVAGPIWHLWHPDAAESPARTDSEEARLRRLANYALTDRYGVAQHDTAAMAAIFAERRGLEGEYDVALHRELVSRRKAGVPAPGPASH